MVTLVMNCRSITQRSYGNKIEISRYRKPFKKNVYLKKYKIEIFLFSANMRFICIMISFSYDSTCEHWGALNKRFINISVNNTFTANKNSTLTIFLP